LLRNVKSQLLYISWFRPSQIPSILSLCVVTVIFRPSQIPSILSICVVGFYCDVCDCDKDYSSQTNLTKHKTNKHEISVPIGCPIDDCPKSFGNFDGLTQHQRKIHIYDYPELIVAHCEECLKPFGTRDGLKIHEEGRYQCDPHGEERAKHLAMTFDYLKDYQGKTD